ncbi:MAG TPA: aldo/keto reductase [Polyangiaceae bacterium]|jgi:diketogulonate reductase-like aldo/keto reductase|nr:aldo/keto reductase [Polyangiaceae bacterium]
MHKRPFGPLGVELPVIGLGTWHLDQAEPAAAEAALRAGLDLGMLHIDTAEYYGAAVEALVGRVIAARRQQVFLVSKIMPHDASRRGTVTTCEKDLKRIGTDYLDCYLIHWPGAHPLEDSIDGLEELRESGKIRAWGVSNFDEPLLAKVLQIAGPGRLACNQVLYHLQQRTIEHQVLPWCEAQGVAVVGYTPFGEGKFPPTGPGGQLLARLAAKHGGTPRQVALAFLTRRDSLFAIPKSSSADHVRENAGAAALKLDESELAALERAFPLGPRRRGVAML